MNEKIQSVTNKKVRKMDEATRTRYVELKEKAKENIKIKKWEQNQSLQEALSSIEKYTICDNDEEKALCDWMNESFSFIGCGHIVWDKVKNEYHKIDKEQLGSFIDGEEKCYILWSDGEVPVVKCNFQDIIKAWDDIECVAFDFFIITVDKTYLAESTWHGDLRIAKMK
jgi:hypothetical protein